MLIVCFDVSSVCFHCSHGEEINFIYFETLTRKQIFYGFILNHLSPSTYEFTCSIYVIVIVL